MSRPRLRCAAARLSVPLPAAWLAGLVLVTVTTGCSESTSPTPPAAAATSSALASILSPTAVAAPATVTPSIDSTVDAPPVAAAETPTRDPFAGIDASQHDVLRNIARIDPAARGVRPAGERQREPRAGALAGAGPASAGAEPATARTLAASGAVAAPVAAAPAPSSPPASAVPVSVATQEPPAPVIAAAPAPTSAASSTPAAATATLSVAASAPSADGRRRALAQPRPVFPVEALRDGHTEGRVIATLTVGADGAVRDVAVVSSIPTRSFGRAATNALRDWRYEAASGNSVIRVELDFRLD